MESHYDEFGNYIGPEVSSEDEEIDQFQTEGPNYPRSGVTNDNEEEDHDTTTNIDESALDASAFTTAIERADQYPSAAEIYGPGVETIVGDVDTQPLEQPIIAPVIEKKFDLIFKEPLETTFDWKFVSETSKAVPDSIRNVVLLGNLHHGKTLLSDVIVEKTHPTWNKEVYGAGFLDYREDEQSRLLSIKSTPFSTRLADTSGTSWMVNIFDTPGHPNFVDECIVSMAGADVAAIVVDVLSGVERHTVKLLREAISHGLSIVLIINCIDRLILELKLPPQDAYHKIRFTIEQVNSVIRETNERTGRSTKMFSPQVGNIAFASGKFGFMFTLQSIAERYCEAYASANAKQMNPKLGVRALQGFDPEELARRLWGDVYYHRDTKNFKRSSTDATTGDNLPRSFVEFVLEPLWKLFATCIAEEKPTVESVLRELGVKLPKSCFVKNTRYLLEDVCKAYFYDSSEVFVDVIRDFGISPLANAATKLKYQYSGILQSQSKFAQGLFSLNKDGYLVAHVFKNYHRSDCQQFDCLARVYSGTLKKGQALKVLGPKYSPSNQEDSSIRVVTDLWYFQGRYRVPIDEAYPGQIVLIGGIDESIVKSATVIGVEGALSANGEIEDVPDVEIFKIMQFEGIAGSVKVSCEPLKPSELPKMVRGIRCLERSYPLLWTRVEDSGEHVLYGSGELMIDCVLHDLRKLYGELEVKVADPVVALQETVLEESAAMAYAETPNGKNKITCVASPLEEDLVKAIDEKRLTDDQLFDPIDRAAMLQNQFGYSELDAKAAWTFGPNVGSSSTGGTCLLSDETLPGSVSPLIKSEVKEYLMQGFHWITREGPLIEEPVRQTKFRLIDLKIADEPIHRGGGQIVPTARKALYSSFLLATPRLMEPILFAEIVCSANAVQACFDVLARRRGYVVKDQPKPGTPLFEVHAYIPAMDSFGFETDIRTHTSGQAMVLQYFDHWSVVPGDPLDRSILLRPLEPSPAPHLAREFTLKTRRRKGLTEDVHLAGIVWE